jgi:hypothetical protein
MQNNLTPLAIVLYLFAICTSYMFITMNASKYSYTGDYKFILFKTLMLVSIIALGFFITTFSCFIYTLPIPNLKNIDFTRNHLVQTFLLYISSVWMALAVALLPFGHTVYNKETGAVDENRTTQMAVMHQVVYTGPYYTFMTLFSIFLFVAFVAIGHTYNKKPWTYEEEGESGSIKNVFSILKYAMNARSTFGFYFRLDPEQYKQLTDSAGQENGGSGGGQEDEY